MELSLNKFVVLIALLETVCGRVISPGEPRSPFQIRLPLPPQFTTFIVSASNINPLGFDFKRIYTPITPVKKVSSYAPIIPLVWVNNLPLFDTPSFKDEPTTQVSSASYKVPRFFKSNFSAFPVERQIAVEKQFNVSSKQIIIPNLELPNFEAARIPITSFAPLKLNFTQKTQEDNSHLFPQESKNVTKSELPKEYNNFSNIQFIENSNKPTGTGTQVPPTIKLPDTHLNETEFESRPNDPVVAESKQQESRSAAQVTFSQKNKSHEVGTEPPKYNFSYSVSNPETRDVKSHSESREGDKVVGEYSVLEADGWTRVVTYVADAGGFRAKVKRVPPS